MAGQHRIKHCTNAPLGRCFDRVCGILQVNSPIGRKDCGVSKEPQDAERTVEMFARIDSHSFDCIVVRDGYLLQ